MTKLLCLLVGMHFRPPAKAILQHLPTGAKVRLEAEPGNQYDPNAIRVLFNGDDLPAADDIDQRNAREADFLSQGFSEEEIRQAPEEWQLGYIAKSGGKPLAGKPWVGNVEVLRDIHREAGDFKEHTASLLFGPAGEPLVAIEIEE